MGYIKIPSSAKNSAKKGLLQRKKFERGNKPGLTSAQASKLKIQSGVQRAYSLIKQTYITEEEAKEVARFYSRWKNCRTPKCQTNHNLWGGRKWGKELYYKFYEN